MRTRYRQKFFTGSVHYENTYNNTSDDVDVVEFLEESIKDEVHAPPYAAEGPLTAISFKGQPIRVNGKRRITGTKTAWFSNAPGPAGYIGAVGPSQWSFPQQGWLNEAIAKIQDTAPAFDLPLSIGEVKDLPHTVRNLGRTLASKRGLSVDDVNDLYLQAQFAARPLVSAALDLLNLQKSIAQRCKSHRRKHREKSAGGRLSSSAIYLGGYHPSNGQFFLPYSGTIYGSREYEQSHEAWYSARLEPVLSLSETLEAVVSNPFGVGRLSAETAWNLIPWSFLVDYFADVSDVLRATDNVLPYKIKSICLMCKTEEKMVHKAIRPSSFVEWGTTDGEITAITKNRWVHNNPTARLALTPFLSWGQLANMASLAAAGSGRR